LHVVTAEGLATIADAGASQVVSRKRPKPW
jgi:hypothetical protein